MSKYPGRVLSATPPAVSTTGASGIWTQEEVAQYNAEGVWPAQPLPNDPYFQNTVLLLHGDGNQGATNFSNISDPVYLAFKDNSDNNFPITVNGDAYGDDFGPYSVSDGYWSNRFDLRNSYLQIATSTDLDLPGDFTIELFVSFDILSSNRVILDRWASSSGWQLYWRSTGGSIAFYQGSSVILQDPSSSSIVAGQWHHIALTREGSTLRLFVDGDLKASTTFTNSMSPTNPLVIGRQQNSGTDYFGGWISNLRIVDGTALYTSSNFTPSTTPLTAVANTALLTCQSNRIVDNSVNNFSIASNIASGGTYTATDVANPFGEVPDGVNGAGFFDGSGDYLSVPDNAAWDFSGDFAIECWVYLNGTGQQHIYEGRVGSTSNALLFYLNSSTQPTIYINGSVALGSSTALVIGQWYYLVASRVSGTLYLFINGVSAATPVANAVSITSPGAIRIGTNDVASSSWLNGYLSNLKVTKGAGYSSVTIPTSPLTSDANTSLLTCQYAGTVRNVGFIDSGPYDFPVTRYGNTTQGTFSPFSKPDGRWGNFFDGSGDYLGFTNSSNSNLGTGDFTVEGWVYPTALSSFNMLLAAGGANNYFCLKWGATSSVFGLNAYNGTQDVNSSTLTTPINQWVHFAFVRISGTLYFYINGVASGSGAFSSAWGSSTGTATIGFNAFYAGQYYYNGYLSSLRVVKGTGIYTSAFTPSTSPLTAISGTSLLTCQSNRFVDNSSNAFAITAAGNVKVTTFSPFPITTAYSPSAYGGSGYFDGTGDYLTLPNVSSSTTVGYPLNLYGVSNTVECWVYPTAFTSSTYFYGTDFDGNYYTLWFLNASTGAPRYMSRSGTSIVSPVNAVLNQWNHVVFGRSGNNVSIWLNGVRTINANITSEDFFGSARLIVGGGFQNANFTNGYLSGLRVVKGVDVYGVSNTTITVPTAPPTAIANTSLLLNFTNGGIYDNTCFNALETVANAQVDTSVVKFGTGSMKFDGTGDYLEKPVDPLYAFGTGDFTIECWYWKSANGVNGYDGIISTATDGNGSNGYYVELSATRGLFFRIGSTNYTNTTTTWINDSTWHHFALSRSGTTLRYFIDGDLKSTFTSSDQMNAGGAVRIGAIPNASNVPTYFFNGYIDDLRITKGVARYTTTFDPPTQAFRNIGA